MARSDLLALTDDGLTQLSNAGIVKRAQRELAAGSGPEIKELDDGTIEARFADNTLTRLLQGKELADASCTCPSSGVCRHRILLAMTYRAMGTGRTDAMADEAERWTPADLDLESFEAAFGTSARAELARLLSARHTVRLDYGQVPAARLPMASVRFLVPNDLGYARCDCAQGRGCVHVSLAIRAFQAAGGASETVIGGNPGTIETVDKASFAAACNDLVRHILDAGVTVGTSAYAQPLERCRRQAELLGASQALLVIDALAEQIEAYEARSARYDESTALRLTVELNARTRASDTAMALGLGEPFETAMAKSRLVSLGARLRQEGQDIRASVLLADSDTGTTMLMERLFSPSPNETQFHASVLRRQFAPGLPVEGVGRGQVLTSVARRRADGLLKLGSGTGGKTQVMPRDGNFSFAPPLAASHADAVASRLSGQPVSLIRPRTRTNEVHVFDVAEVLGQAWSAGTQFWEAGVRLPDEGGILHLAREFDAGAPMATAILAAAIDGRWGNIRQVAGPVRLEGGVLICEPWSLSADRFIVPDLDSLGEAVTSATPPPGSRPPDMLDEAERLLAGAIHAGDRARANREAVGRPLTKRLATAGFVSLAARLDDWLAAQTAKEPNAFYQAAVWLLALRESRETDV